MGMQLFVKSGTFKPTDYGLGAGDVLNVICVGGGQGGTGYAPSYLGGNGAASSFGSYLTAAGGSESVKMFQGPGAGGYIIGDTEWGGRTNAPRGSAGSTTEVCSKYGGIFKSSYGTEGLQFGGGGGAKYGGGGGYGAGGGSGGDTRGGNSGLVTYATITLPSSNSITVSVGGGGSGSAYNRPGNPGTTSGGGAKVVNDNNTGGAGGYNNLPGGTGEGGYGSGGGAGGCVIVFW